jgi:hypothetical protein
MFNAGEYAVPSTLKATRSGALGREHNNHSDEHGIDTREGGFRQ